MKRFTIFSLTCFLSMGSVFAQQGVTQCGVPTGQPKFPLQAYQELPDPAAPSEKEWAAVTAPQVSWGTIDVRYAKHQLPALKKTTNTSLKGWRGERVQGDTCKEGVLEWVPKEKVTELPIWEGDKIFFRLLNGDRPYFSLKLVYDGDTLKQAVLDGKQIVGKT